MINWRPCRCHHSPQDIPVACLMEAHVHLLTPHGAAQCTRQCCSITVLLNGLTNRVLYMTRDIYLMGHVFNLGAYVSDFKNLF
jgi:hypothetical protein